VKILLHTILIIMFAATPVLAQGEGAAEKPDPRVEQFEQLRTQAAERGASLTEAQVRQLLQLGMDLGKPYTAERAVKAYFTRNLSVSPSLLLLAAHNARLAADYPTAVARYKAYLNAAGANGSSREAADAAGWLYEVQLPYLRNVDDAYATMREYGSKLRGSNRAVQYDGWFLSQARRRNDYAAVANRLRAIMSEKRPIEQERLLHWPDLEWLLHELSRPESSRFDALADARELPGLIRGNSRLAMKARLIVSQLDYYAGKSGKNPDQLADEYDKVIAVAMSWFDQYPELETYIDACKILMGGLERPRDPFHVEQPAGKHRFTRHAFPRLKPDEQTRALNWDWHGQRIVDRMGDVETWIELGVRRPGMLEDTEAHRVNLIHVWQEPQKIRQAATAFEGVDSASAAMTRAMAKESDLTKAALQAWKQDAWHFAGREPWDYLVHHAYHTAYKNWPQNKTTPIPGDYLGKHIATLGEQIVTQSALALFDRDFARDSVTHAWRISEGDRADFIRYLEKFAWVPYNDQQRQQVFGSAYSEFKRWTDDLRKAQGGTDQQLKQAQSEVQTHQKELDSLNKALASAKQGDDQAKIKAFEKNIQERKQQLEAARKKVTELQKKDQTEADRMKIVTNVEAAFKKALDADAPLAKAPDEVTAAMVEAIHAIRENNREAYVKAARKIYQKVRFYETSTVPMARQLFDWVLDTRLDSFDTFEFELEVLKDQLAVQDGNRSIARASRVMSRIFDGRRGWGWGSLRKSEMKQAKQMNDIFADTIRTNIEKNRFESAPIYWYRTTRHGHGWRQHDWNDDVYARIVESGHFTKNDYAVAYGSPVVGLMWWQHSEIKTMRSKYPTESYFDDMFIAEIKERGVADWDYFNWGRDPKGKVTNHVASVLVQYDTLPFGYEANPRVVWPHSEFWRWQNRALSAEESTRTKLQSMLEASFGKTRFDHYAMGSWWFEGPAEVVTAEGRKTFFEKLDQYLDRAEAQPARNPMPFMGRLEELAPEDLTDAELATLARMLTSAAPAQWHAKSWFEHVARLVFEASVARERWALLSRSLPQMWQIARDTGNSSFSRELAAKARSLQEDGKVDLAAVMSVAGLAMLDTDLPEDASMVLRNVKNQALLAVGEVVSVPKSDRRYPIFAAQAAYQTGQLESAWKRYQEHPNPLREFYKELDPAFVIWVIQQNTDAGNYRVAEQLSREMIQWIDSAPDGFENEIRARMALAYANIAMAQREYPRARAQYERIEATDAFDGTRAQVEAELSIADIDRLTGAYDRANQRLQKMTRQPDKWVQAEAHYHLALVARDQEQWSKAKEEVEKVFLVDLRHSRARILEGELYNKLRQYDRSRDLKVGLQTRQQFLVPGRPLKIDLADKNLAATGGASNVEIRVWTTSGDEETFNLFPVGDNKTEFSGEIRTELGSVKPSDHILQVRGDDTVLYDFSTDTRAAQDNATEPQELKVVTNSELAAASGRIRSKEEVAEARLEDEIRRRLRLEEGYERADTLSTRRPDDQIKPGNPINIRVIDPDRSVSPDRNTITVSVEAKNGDAIRNFVLTETEPFSGVFEGAVPTASGVATAYATDSQEGRMPNFVISAGDHPAWVAQPDNVRPKVFSVDLNGNVALGGMQVVADVAGRKLKSFELQTSMNGRDFRTVRSWPKEHTSWDGSPQMEMSRIDVSQGRFRSVSDFREYFERGYISAGTPKATRNVEKLAANWNHDPAGLYHELNMQHNTWYIARFKAAFYLPRGQVRTFKVDPKGRTDNVRYMVAVDGKVADSRNAATWTGSLDKGVHVVELLIVAYRHSRPTFELMVDSPEPPYMVPAPKEMFDPDQHPQIREQVAVQPAELSVSEDQTTFDFAFAPGARARVVRLLIKDFETDAPAIRRISLTDEQGEQVLPTQQNLMELTKNDVLEIVPGDRISITYEDPKVLDERSQTQESFLTATYSNAELSAAFVEYKVGRSGERIADYIPMRRFKTGDRINVFIKDSDMDTTDDPDVIEFTARSDAGESRTIKARETEAHSGVFTGTVFPVETEPTRAEQVKVGEGMDLVLTYHDSENTDPGIPWDRNYRVEQTWNLEPEMRIYEVTSRELTEEELDAVAEARKQVARQVEEYVPARRMMVAARSPEPTFEPIQKLISGPLLVELIYPTIAQSPESEAEIYLQTKSAREQYGTGTNPGDAFNLNLPGTIRLTRTPGDVRRVETPPGYRNVIVRGNPYAPDALDEGRFTFLVHTEQMETQEESFSNWEPEAYRDEPPALAFQGDDVIYVGFRYKPEEGEQQWKVREVHLTSDVFFDVMDRPYQSIVEGIHVGENLYFRVIHRTEDLSDEKDALTVTIQTESGASREVRVVETLRHSGVFKGHITLAHRDESGTDDASILPVVYGDKLTVTYSAGDQTHERQVTVYKGADGDVIPFTKQFKDPQIAVQTQFTIAEAYFEQAKRHRELGQEDISRREIAQGKKLLEEAIRDFPDTEARAQAEYLLANLAFEFAKDAENAEIKKQYHLEAITRFNDIVASFPDSPYAPKSQFKKALVLETMGQLDEACEEYVKLSYRYPDNELVAETIARLGQYFLAKGKEYEARAEKQADPVEKEKILIEMRQMFTTAAQVFGRLQVRFPEHRLAHKTTLLSGQCFMLAEKFGDAVEVFTAVYEDKQADNDLAAEAMYWAGDCHNKARQLTDAYRTWKRLTWDYPESRWAKFARGRLTEDDMVRIEMQDTQGG